MRVVVEKDYEAMSRCATDLVQKAIEKDPQCLVSFPGGDTPVGMLREFVSRVNSGMIDPTGVKFVQLDDWVGICLLYTSPHMTVYENMAFPLKLRKRPKSEIDKAVREAAEILDITQYLDRKPKALSGGQRQRVAIGRAIVREPKILLMDEPLSNLDAKLRNQMRAEIIKLRQKINTTFLYVTHDQTEAMTCLLYTSRCV